LSGGVHKPFKILIVRDFSACGNKKQTGNMWSKAGNQIRWLEIYCGHVVNF